MIRLLILIIATTFISAATDMDSSPINIQSNHMRYYGKDKISIFTGNVVAFNDSFNLTTDNLTVLLDENSAIDKIFCNGNVNLKTDDIISTSEHAEVDEKAKIAILTGNVKVWQADNLLEGEKITIFYKENKILVDKGEESRVTIIFKPETKDLKTNTDNNIDNNSPIVDNSSNIKDNISKINKDNNTLNLDEE